MPGPAPDVQQILDRDPGLNSILLDMATTLGGVASDVRHVRSRVETMESTLWKLEAARLEQKGWRDGVKRTVTLGRALWAMGLGGIAFWAWQHIAPFLPRV